MTLKIFGFVYEVVEDIEINNLSQMAITDPDKYIIRLAVGLTDQQKKATILHEIMEALKNHTGNADKWDHDLIEFFETLAFMVLEDNGVDLSPLIRSSDKRADAYIAVRYVQ